MTQATSLDLQVVVVKEAASEVHEAVKERAIKMLRTVLEAVSAKDQWKYIITGLGAMPTHQSQYWMEQPIASNMMIGMVQIIIRSRLTPGGTLLGMLRLPQDVNRKTFLEQVEIVIKSFNHAHWQDIVEREERQEMKPASPPKPPARTQPVARPATDADADDGSAARAQSVQTSNDIARQLVSRRSVLQAPVPAPKPPVAPPTPPSTPVRAPASSPLPQIKEATMPAAKLLADEAKLQEFVRRAVNGSEDGVVYSRQTMPLIREIFPDYQATSGPLFKVLVNREYLEFLDHGQYRVTPGFAQKHGLNIIFGLLSSGATEGVHGDSGKLPASTVGSNGASKPGRKKKQSPRLGISELVQAIQDIRRTWDDLESDVRAAEANLRAAQAGVVTAQENLEAAQRRFEEHNERLRTALGTFGRGGNSLAALLTGPAQSVQQ